MRVPHIRHWVFVAKFFPPRYPLIYFFSIPFLVANCAFMYIKDPPSTDRHCMPQNNCHLWKSSQISNSSNQIAAISNANFHNKNKRSKSLSVGGGPLKTVKLTLSPVLSLFYGERGTEVVADCATTRMVKKNKPSKDCHINGAVKSSSATDGNRRKKGLAFRLLSNLCNFHVQETLDNNIKSSRETITCYKLNTLLFN